MTTTVVNVRTGADCDILIMRPGPWGNPFPVGEGRTREEALAMYEVHIRRRPDLLARLPELAGKRLGCCCDPFPCHGNILIKLIKERGLE